VSDEIAEIAESVGCCDYDGVELLEVACSHPGPRLSDMGAAVVQRECKMDGVGHSAAGLLEAADMY
jgi:hypothetical protein